MLLYGVKTISADDDEKTNYTRAQKISFSERNKILSYT